MRLHTFVAWKQKEADDMMSKIDARKRTIEQMIRTETKGSIVRREPAIIVEIKQADDLKIPQSIYERELVEIKLDAEWVRGEATFANTRRNTSERAIFSEPIIVEGTLYRLYLFPNGSPEAAGTHISVGLQWKFLGDLGVNPPLEIYTYVEMLHNSGDHAKGFSVGRKVENLEGEKCAKSYIPESMFYPKPDLVGDGFIHANESLKFFFYIRKNNSHQLLKLKTQEMDRNAAALVQAH